MDDVSHDPVKINGRSGNNARMPPILCGNGTERSAQEAELHVKPVIAT